MESILSCGRRLAWLCIGFMPAICACAAEPDKDVDKDFGRPHIDKVDGDAKILKDVKVLNFKKVVYEGDIDINPTLERIRKGKPLDHRNDGAVFRNREELLPVKKDKEYYREFVHAMKDLPFPGPQRVIIGKGGEVYYTADHYESFTQVK